MSRRFALTGLWLCAFSACFPLERSGAPTGPPACDAGEASFVAETTLTLLGRRPLSHTEVELGIATIGRLESEFPGEGRRRFALALMDHPAFLDRWSDLLLDDLDVPRTGVQSMASCYGESLLTPEEDGHDDELALFVLDNTGIDDQFGRELGGVSFTFRDLLRQSIVVDDVSPIYRAHLYALLTRLNGCGNVDPVGQELAFRDEVGHVFEAAYLNRDPVCLACHNTEISVTDDVDPDKDRHWPLRGNFEESVFGASTVSDPRVPRAVFRVADFVGGGGGVNELAGDVGYCFDMGSMSVIEAPCVDDQIACGDGFPFCTSPTEVPSCNDDGTGDTVATCPNQPFCSDANFQVFDVAVCDGGVATCADANNFFALCGDFVSTALCGPDGVPFCELPPDPGEGEGEGEDAAAGTFTPWGADPVCGSFAAQVATDDPAAVDAHFASLRGQRVTVVQLEQSLKRGVDALAARGLVVDDNNVISNPDDAFAYLVAQKIVDNVWREVTGTPLTISTHFPRNVAQRDLLQDLSDRFVASHFSLRGLLADIVTGGYVNIQAPEDGCRRAPDDGGRGDPIDETFAWPPVFDPWVRDEPVVAERSNSAADAVHALSARTLLSAAYAALSWPAPDDADFPGAGDELDFACFDMFLDCPALELACSEGQCCAEKDALCGVVDGPLTEAEVQSGIGVFHGISEKGFRGLDFQARLFFESRFGVCGKPAGVDDDAIDAIVARVARTGTVRDAVLLLKERITRDTSFDKDERELVEGLFGGSLDRAAAGVDLDPGLRVLCGALLASPQFQLTGIATKRTPPARLQPSLAEVCEEPLPGCR